jgi:hypothetical protein
MKLLYFQRELPVWAGIVGLGAATGLPAYWFGSMFSSSALIEAPYFAVALAVAAYSMARNGLVRPPMSRPIIPHEILGFNSETASS